MISRRRRIAYGIALAAVSVMLVSGFLELYLRAILFHNFTLGDGLLKHEGLYADYFSDDDFWKLRYYFGDIYSLPEHPHPLLGWVGEFDRITYYHNDENSVGKRTPVLLYGDSFAKCVTPVCFQHILNGDKDFSKNYYLLNYAVGGYGLDQIELLYEKSNKLYEDPVVIFSFLTDDIDRSALSFRIGQKPYYKVENGALVLNGVPVDPDAKHFLKEHPISIKSYLWAYLIHNKVIPERVIRYLRGDEQKVEMKKNVSRAIIQKTIDDLRERHVRFFVIVFQPDWPDAIDGPDSWRDTLSREILDRNHVPYIWTKGLILADMKKTGKNISEYFDVGGHYNDYANNLIAPEIKKMVLEH